MMEMMLVTACIVQRFDVHLVHPVEIDAGITLRPRGGLHIQLVTRPARIRETLRFQG